MPLSFSSNHELIAAQDTGKAALATKMYVQLLAIDSQIIQQTHKGTAKREVQEPRIQKRQGKRPKCLFRWWQQTHTSSNRCRRGGQKGGQRGVQRGKVQGRTRSTAAWEMRGPRVVLGSIPPPSLNLFTFSTTALLNSSKMPSCMLQASQFTMQAVTLL